MEDIIFILKYSLNFMAESVSINYKLITFSQQCILLLIVKNTCLFIHLIISRI